MALAGVLGAALALLAAGTGPTAATGALTLPTTTTSTSIGVTVPGVTTTTVSTPPPPSLPGVSVPQTTTSTTSSSTTTPPPASNSSQPSGGSGGSSSGSTSQSQGGAKSHQPPTIVTQAKQQISGAKTLATTRTQSQRKVKSQVAPPLVGLRQPNGLPTPTNPSLTIALPGAPTPGVPDFFINEFRIPPFLLPIYQAAGTQYDVPWQILAAINEVETDYGRDLSISTAGAVGWMQFLPQTWQQWGVDATGSGVKDPYNPVDAIFAAARYLHAAGASTNLRGAIFAYNHATWYVDSVILRAKLIGGLPPQLLGALTGLTYGHFPVHASARYADDLTEQALAARYARTHNAALTVDPVAHRSGINIYAKSGSPVIAVQDGRIVAMGHDRSGYYIRLQDAYGNTYTYGDLAKLSSVYPVPKPQTQSSAQPASALSNASTTQHDKAPSAPASAGYQPLPVSQNAAAANAATGAAPTPTTAPAAPAAPPAPPTDIGQVASQVLGSANPFAGPAPQVFQPQSTPSAPASPPSSSGLPAGQSFNAYFSDVYGLNRNDVVLRPLTVGSKVIGGTILGRIGTTSQTLAPHVLFQIQPAGKNAPLIDPKPILDGWVLLERTSIYRAKGQNPFVNGAATVGQVLLESKQQLQQQVLSDPHVDIYSCGRRDIEAGQIDQRVLASIEFLSVSGLRPTVSSLRCGQSGTGQSFTASEHASGNAVTFSAFNGIPVVGHQGKDSITDIAVRRMLSLQGINKPFEIISQLSYPGTDNTLSMSNHFDHVEVAFLPLYNTDPRIRKQVDSALAPSQWIKLIGRLNQIAEPQVSPTPSPAAIPDTTKLGHK